MRRIFLPGLCPECGAPTTGEQPRCGVCGLVLAGAEADELRAALARADQLLERQRALSLRAGSAATPAPATTPPATTPPATAPVPATATAEAAPGVADEPARRRGWALPAVSVPVVLLGLGTVCVLVAALVFVAVTWTDLSLAWRTTVLLGVTGLATSAGVWVLRRGLRGAAEALTLVSSGLLCIDLLAGNSAGLPLVSLLEGTAFGWLVAVVLGFTGLGWVLGAQRSPSRSLLGEQVVVVAAMAAMVGLSIVGWDFALEWLAAVLTVVSTGVALATWRLRAGVVAVAATAIGLLSWSYLALAGAERAVLTDSTRELFLGLGAAPVVVASLLAGVVACVGRVPKTVRGTAAAVTVAGPVLVLLLPARDLDPTPGVLVVAAGAVALAATALVMPFPWRPGLRAVAGTTAALPAVLLLGAAGLAVLRVLGSAAAPWSRGILDPLADPGIELGLASWVHLVVGPAVLATGSVAVRGHVRALRDWLVAGALLGAVTSLLLSPWPLLVVTGLLTAACGGWSALPSRRAVVPWPYAFAALTLLTLVCALSSVTATAAFYLLHGGLLLMVARRVRGHRRSTLAVFGVALWGAALEAAADLAGLSGSLTGMLLVGAAVVTALLAQRLASADDGASWRRGLEGVAAAMAVVGLLQAAEDEAVRTVALAVVALATGYVAAVVRDRRVLSAVSLVALAATAHQVVDLTGVPVAWAAVAATTVAGVGALLAQLASAYRRFLEPSAALVTVVSLSAQTEHPLALAVGLTVAGVAAVLVSFASADRRPVAWVGGGLLVLASWVRLYDLRVDVVEAYTLPGATALVVTGLLWMRRTASATSWQGLGAGLSLGVGPSLAVALGEPTSVRALLVGLAALALVLAGTRLRWGAPLLIGGLSAAALAVVNIAPYAAALPRWVLFGAAGVLLLGLGVTWEQRRQDLQGMHRYATRLR